MEKRYHFQTADQQPIGKSAFADRQTILRFVRKAITLGFSTLQKLDTRTGEKIELTHYVTNRQS